MIKSAHAAPTSLSQEYGFGTVTSLGELINQLVLPAFSIAGVILLVYLLYAGYKFLTSAGDKNTVAEAREMITHAIIGFFLLILLFLVLQFLPSALGLTWFQVVR